jgi:isopentenyl diphosphate isomerase/L-lactate dehydrogenase-like FMN-dependent dehydrogenase
MKRYRLLAILPALLLTGAAHAQYPIMDMIADNIVQKYQQANCEQLWEQKGKPKSEREQEMIKMLRADPQMRSAFVNKVAPTIVNKMFECGMVP